MAKDGGGSNSDVEEITSDDFKIRDSSGSRVWMNDLMRYSSSRNFNQDLYSFAWAQAVQNKPLGFDVAKKEDDDDEIEMFVVDDDENENEKEEGEGDGELEEGEIGFGSETANNAEEKKVEEEVMESEEKVEEEIGEFDKRVGTILEELDSVTEEEAESSFEEVCSRLQKAFASLKQMFSEGHNPVLDVLALQAFMGIQTVYSAFSSGNLKEMDQNKELLLRLLIHIKNQYSVLLTTEQVKEIDIRVHTLASEDVTVEKTGDVPEVPSVKLGLVPSGNNSVVSNNKLDVPTSFRNRVEFSPLLNLHADYDEDSLPSPTRDSAPPLPVLKPIGIGVRATVPNQKTVESANGTFHPYVTDAFNAVSSYQQKYGNNSNFVCNDLPSPTPSEDGNGGGGGGGDDDTHGEVSSSSVISKVRNVEPNNTVAIPQSAPIKTVGLTPVLKSSAKSRDPRLRFMNTQDGPLANSRKHKATEEPANDDHTLKRQRNGLMSSRNVQVQPNENMVVGSRNIATGEVGIDRRLNCNSNFNGLNGCSVHNNPNGLNGGSVPNTSTSTVPSVLLPSLLKGIAVNPTMLMQLVQMEQQRMAAEGQHKLLGPIGNGLPVAPSNASVKPLEVGKQPAANPHQMPPQSAPMNTQKETGVIRMKPRDPRRILLTNMVQKSEGSGPEPGKSSARLQSDMQRSNDPLTVREQGEQAQHAIFSSQSTTPKPDIKNAKDHADSTSQPIPGKVSNNSTESKTQGAPTANPWGDVDHLLDGYDEQQKAAVQKERARRIEEQSKMFSSKKLCLVLDLDHTLLNSAKFIEVDPAHEEILRKKEEQDRAKPQRHLFRFHHMGMWTKLRPGIWNFLEKASKLYELHLYTMGNKLYATEMAKVLDPTGALFAGRVISKGDEGDSDGDERVPKNKDLDGVLGMESAVVIIDDSVRIWPHNKLNLIVVERYTYFPCSRRQFGLAGPSLLEIDHDERPEAGTLASSLGVIERIHQNFFSHQVLKEVDVRNILASEQRKILAGCKIVFSRIFPVGEANPHLHPLWQAAEQFGAECTNQIDEHVTHVVANSLGTDKVNWALSTGRFVVHPSWVEASTLLYRRANEQDFAVKI